MYPDTICIRIHFCIWIQMLILCVYTWRDAHVYPATFMYPFVSTCVRQKLISIGCLVTKWRPMMTTVCAVSSVVVALVARRKRRRPRSCWVRDWLQKRPQHGTHVALLSSPRSSDPSTYRNFCRMTPDDYDELLRMVRPAITHSDTKYRKAISWATCIHLYPVCVYTMRYKWIQMDTNGCMYPK